MGQNILSVRNLSVMFKGGATKAVSGLSFNVKRGETLAIVGESGSGKSVMSLSIMRLIEPSSARLSGEVIFHPPSPKSPINLINAPLNVVRSIRGADIAMIFQEPMTSLNPVFSVGEQIAESIRVHQGANNKAAKQQAIKALSQVRIPDPERIFNSYPHQLSGGMRQRVVIAMALACKPSLLIADEPTTALDVTIEAQILTLLSVLQQELGMAIIFITHDMGVVAEVADRVLVMYRGQKVEEGDVRSIFKEPAHPYTRELLSFALELGVGRRVEGIDDGITTLKKIEEDYKKGKKADKVSNKVDETLTEMTAEIKGIEEKKKIEKKKIEEEGEGRVRRRGIEEEVKEGRATKEQPILRVRDLVTYFPFSSNLFGRTSHFVHALDRVSFDLYEQETLAIVGESGSGKSTLGRSLLQLVNVLSGSVEFMGEEMVSQDAGAIRRLRRNIQFIFQDPFSSLNPRLNIGFSIMEPLLIHGMSREAAKQRSKWLLERVGLGGLDGRYPHEFSGGQRQRICIARALALNPKVVIADEAVSALDVSIRAQIIALLLELQEEFGISFLFISHDMGVVERVSHRVAVMYLGEIVELGLNEHIFKYPIHPYTKRLLQAVPSLDPSMRRRNPIDNHEIKSAVFKKGEEREYQRMIEVNHGHFVRQH